MSQESLLGPVWAGTEVAAITSDTAVLNNMLEIEASWGEVLAAAGWVAPEDAQALRRVVDTAERNPALDSDALAVAAVAGGNPVIPLVNALRSILNAAGAGDSALHRAATSQDILDSAQVLMIRQVAAAVIRDARAAGQNLAELAQDHRKTVCVARSLTQYALPTVFGLRVASWLDGITAALSQLEDALFRLGLQWGGAAGAQAALVELVGSSQARQLSEDLGQKLGLPVPTRPWQVQRQPILAVAGALAALLAALGKYAADVLMLQRPEIAELRETVDEGGGGSSAMPQKQNPVRSMLIRSAAIAGPGQLSVLYQAAAMAHDERPDGAWHAEWTPLRELLRLSGGAAARARELSTRIVVDPHQMQAHVDAAGDGLISERLIIALSPSLPGGAGALRSLVTQSVQQQQNLFELVGAAYRAAGLEVPHNLSALFEKSGYTGRSAEFIDTAVEDFQRVAGTL